MQEKVLGTVVLCINKEADSIKKQAKAHVIKAILFFSVHNFDTLTPRETHNIHLSIPIHTMQLVWLHVALSKRKQVYTDKCRVKTNDTVLLLLFFRQSRSSFWFLSRVRISIILIKNLVANYQTHFDTLQPYLMWGNHLRRELWFMIKITTTAGAKQRLPQWPNRKLADADLPECLFKINFQSLKRYYQ